MTDMPAQDDALREYFARQYSPDWDGGYDVERFPSYGAHWRTLNAQWNERLDELGAYGAAAAEEAFMRARRREAVERPRRARSGIGATRSLSRLDELTRELPYVPVTTATWRRAASLWAAARNTGNVTAPPEALDGDVLVAAQALEESAVVLTNNTRHFESLSVAAVDWTAVPPGAVAVSRNGLRPRWARVVPERRPS